jgi:hypothetical protein
MAASPGRLAGATDPRCGGPWGFVQAALPGGGQHVTDLRAGLGATVWQA